MLNKKRNIYIIPSLGYGGAESFLLRLIPYMKNENIIITLYHTRFDKQRIKDKNTKYITLDPLRTSLEDYLQFLKLIISLNKNDTVFSWLYISDLFASLLKLLLFWKKFSLIWNIRNTVITVNEYSLIAYFSYSVLRIFLMGIPNKIIFNSEASMSQHIKKGYNQEKSSVIYNGFERYASIKKYKNPNNTFNIIYVARYHPQKNHKLLFLSIKQFKEDYNCDFKLHLVGKDLNKKNNNLLEYLEALGIAKNITFYDLIHQSAVHDLFSKSDITLLLSTYGESFPNVIAEAMLYGTFPIATNIGDTKSIINKFGDVISKNASPSQISEIIYKYYLIKNTNISSWEKRIKECQDFAKNRFGIEKSARKFMEISNN